MIYLIITSCLVNRFGCINEQHRNNNYINSINTTLSLLPSCIRPIIVENNGNRKTFLDDFKIPVHYTDNNKIKYYHKGLNELDDIKSTIEKFGINDDDIIIKLTGRYHPLNNTFFNFVIENQYKYDIFVKFFNVSTLQFAKNDCVLGLFAIKCKYLKQFNYNKNQNSNSPEVEFAMFVRNTQSNLYEINNLYLRCCFADNLRILDV